MVGPYHTIGVLLPNVEALLSPVSIVWSQIVNPNNLCTLLLAANQS